MVSAALGVLTLAVAFLRGAEAVPAEDGAPWQGGLRRRYRVRSCCRGVSSAATGFLCASRSPSDLLRTGGAQRDPWFRMERWTGWSWTTGPSAPAAWRSRASLGPEVRAGASVRRRVQQEPGGRGTGAGRADLPDRPVRGPGPSRGTGARASIGPHRRPGEGKPLSSLGGGLPGSAVRSPRPPPVRRHGRRHFTTTLSPDEVDAPVVVLP